MASSAEGSNTVSSAEIARKIDAERRLHCPEHHTRLDYRGGRIVHCRGCGFGYRFERLTDTETDALADAPPPDTALPDAASSPGASSPDGPTAVSPGVRAPRPRRS